MAIYEKRITSFDHDDANDYCKALQKKYEESCYHCRLKRDGKCQLHLFIERDRLNSIIRETFGDETIRMRGE